MKRLLLFISTLLCANVLMAQTTFWIDSLQYEITSTNPAEVEVNDANLSITTANIPETVSYEGINYNVTSIGDEAFYNCSSLTSITIPSSVTEIKENAFQFCESLTSIDIPNSVTTIEDHAFAYCNSLESVTIGNSVTEIGDYAFHLCTGLTSVTIGNSVTEIGWYAFNYCFNLTSIICLAETAPTLGDNVFSSTPSTKTLTYPCGSDYSTWESTTTWASVNEDCIGNRFTIGDLTYEVTSANEVKVYDCDVSAIQIEIPSIVNDYNVTSIGEFAFDYCEDLTSVTIPNSVTSIGNWTFYFCSSLTSITIPNSVTSIGDGVFINCSSLTSVTIPNSVPSIGTYAFADCSSLDSVICLAETAPLLGNNVFASTSSTKVLNIPFGSDYSSWQSATDWSKTNYLIQKGETKELANDFTINSTTGLINQGVLRIKQSGQLINQTGTNVSGIFEIETPTLANNKWSFIGAPFNNYKLEAVKPGSQDISISLFDYTTGNWSNDFATIEDEVGAGEGFFAWSFAAEPTVFTTYGDGAEEYNFEDTSEYALNNGAVTVTKNLTTHAEGGNWLALSNPYTFKLDVNKFLSEQSNIKGGVVYRFNGETWDDVQAGVINMTEGFFVNYETAGAHSVSFSKSHRYDGAKKAETKKDYMKLLLNDGERTTRLLFAQNDKAKQGDDLFDANKLFSPLEITEPYFVTDGVALVKEEVNALPYTANLNIRNYENKEVTISIDNIPEGVTVFLLDNGQDIKMNGGVEYTTTITEGENADRFQLLVKKQQKIERNTNNQITIKNNNRQITITSDITNLNIEVYNNLGQKVFATKDYNFTLDQLPSGSYVVKAYQGRLTQSQKIVIE